MDFIRSTNRSQGDMNTYDLANMQDCVTKTQLLFLLEGTARGPPNMNS